ncbi:Peroxiredoxin [Flavobacteriaceae bacterium MAR_2010_188]|nr:Peroxiredoxin [Flavobacteriaceae bacterium MAR_2010_188]
MKKSTKKEILQYSIFLIIALTLYMTGLHTEVIGFVQRGIVSTGLLNPHLNISNNDANGKKIKADLGLLLIDESGKTIALEELEGKVIFINLWATRCPPCIAEMPGINALYKEFKDEDDVKCLMISLDNNFETAKSFIKRKGFEFEVYTPRNLPVMYDSGSIPSTFIIDKEGNLVLTHKGMADYDTSKFKEFIRQLK